MNVDWFRSSDAEDLTNLFADAFQNDPVWTASHPDPTRRIATIRSWSQRLALSKPTIDVVRDNDGHVIAALWWERAPQRTSLERSDTSDQGLADSHDRTIALNRPSDAHFYIHDVAVAPHRQGEGLGTLLLTHRLGATDHAGLPTWLEATSAASQRLYTRHGFTPVRTLQPVPDVTTVLMRRPASFEHVHG